MIFKIKTFNNMMKIIEGFTLEGYKVTVHQVMKEFPREQLVDYFEIVVEQEKETNK